MAGTITYDTVDLKFLTFNEQRFASNYSNLLGGGPVEFYNSSALFPVSRIGESELLPNRVLRHYISVLNQHNMLIRIKASMNKRLPNDIVDGILGYIRSLHSDDTITTDSIQDTFMSIKFKRSEHEWEYINSMSLLLEDQLSHFTSDTTTRKGMIWHVDCKHNGYELGSILVYYNVFKPMMSDGRKGLVVQDIVKYPIPYLTQLLFPQYGPYIPKLNNIVEPPINAIADELDLDYIFVRPIGSQGNTLTKHYGYKEIDVELAKCVYKEVDKSSSF
jgi:hypothetical protein